MKTLQLIQMFLFNFIWRRWIGEHKIEKILGWRSCYLVRGSSRSRVTFLFPWEYPNVTDFKSALIETYRWLFPKKYKDFGNGM